MPAFLQSHTFQLVFSYIWFNVMAFFAYIVIRYTLTPPLISNSFGSKRHEFRIHLLRKLAAYSMVPLTLIAFLTANRLAGMTAEALSRHISLIGPQLAPSFRLNALMFSGTFVGPTLFTPLASLFTYQRAATYVRLRGLIALYCCVFVSATLSTLAII